jgi:hypothetical protein
MAPQDDPINARTVIAGRTLISAVIGMLLLIAVLTFGLAHP